MTYSKNNIYNVDAYEAIKEIPSKSVQCVYTDVPYLMPNCKNSGGGFMADRVRRVATKELNTIKGGLDYIILDEFVRVCKPINIFIWCNKFLIKDILNYFIDKYGCKKYEIMVWCKTNPIPMTHNVWLSDLEYCLWFGEKGVKLNDGYDIKSKYYISEINQKDKKALQHPTIKPLELVKRHLLHTTQVGDVVLDPFLGSGTTAVACKETNRNYIGFEIDKNYFEIAQDRLKGLNQQEKKIKEQGQTDIFDFIGDN